MVADFTDGTVTPDTDITFTHTPNTGHVGSGSFTFRFSDALGPGNTATVSIDVYNNTPVASDASYRILHDTTLTGQVYGYDLDGDSITAQLVTGPTNGTVTLNPDGTFSYSPSAGYAGSDSFTFTFSDPLGPGNTATVRTNVYNNTPVATDASFSILHDTTLTDQVYGYDLDGDAITAELVTWPRHGSVALDPNGTFTYTPDPGHLGLDSFAYRWADTLTVSAEATVTIEVYCSTSEPPLDGSDGGAGSVDAEKSVVWLEPDTARLEEDSELGLRVRRNGLLEESVTIAYRLSGTPQLGSAGGEDYSLDVELENGESQTIVGLVGVITIPAHSDELVLRVRGKVDGKVEGPEIIFFDILPSTMASQVLGQANTKYIIPEELAHTDYSRTASTVITLKDVDSGVVVRSLAEFAEVLVLVDEHGELVSTNPARLYVSLSRQPVEPVFVRISTSENAPILVAEEGDLSGSHSVYLRFDPESGIFHKLSMLLAALQDRVPTKYEKFVLSLIWKLR